MSDLDKLTTPKTEAGRTVLNRDHRAVPTSPEGMANRNDALQAILAIEQEAGRLAVAEALSVERIAAALPAAGLSSGGQRGTSLEYFAKAAVVLRAALLSPEQPDSEGATE